ncbi:DUF3253 domain-containing protein [Sphingomonas sp. SAFR-052]|uniref:DUF3253 domain-containing protein n=1 Tax=Sphingomonas sp. SAFR-052 TaxID=3436867 RepID=UPI003F807E2A
MAEPISDPVATACATTLTLLAARAACATVCPSEVARAMAAADPGAPAWRDLMPVVHRGVDRLLAEDRVRLRWKGQALATRTGPYRIARAVR